MRLGALLIVLMLAGLASAQYYDIAFVRANDSTVQSIVYDDNSTSYKDNSIENPDLELRICAADSSDLLGKWVGLYYADGFDGDYLALTHAPIEITSVPPNNCPYLPMDISSFRAWYPSIPYVFISDSPDMSSADRWKLSRLRGWFIGNYSLTRNQTGSNVDVNVTAALDDHNDSMVPDVDYLVVGLVREDYTTMSTGITSINDSIPLTSDSPSATYKIFINGIGPDMPPYVEILTPEPITYDTGIIPFTYIMIDDDDIADCWYVLDGNTVNMPVCGIAYLLDVSEGDHSLTLYARDTTGNVGSDHVDFSVETTPPPPPGPGPSPGGGGPPYYQPIPGPPPKMFFDVIPENINVVVDYPLQGKTEFAVFSNSNLTDVVCFLDADFAKYTTIEVPDKIHSNGPVTGTISVNMSSHEIMKYDGGMSGVMQCVGKVDRSLLASTQSNVYLHIHKPMIEIENRSLDVEVGSRGNISMLINNTGSGNATAVNISVRMGDYRYMAYPIEYPESLGAGDTAFLVLFAELYDVEPGIYNIPVDIYENGFFMSRGFLNLDIEEPAVPAFICRVPDLRWTALVLLIGLIVSIWMFRKKLIVELIRLARAIKVSSRLRKTADKERWKVFVRPAFYAVSVMIFFVLLWMFIVWLLARCQ
jgi:hypothetical protein